MKSRDVFTDVVVAAKHIEIARVVYTRI